MNTDLYVDLGPQNAGEPLAETVTPEPEKVIPEVEPPPEADPQVEEDTDEHEEDTPEQKQAKKHKAGSQKRLERALRAEARAELLEQQLREAKAPAAGPKPSAPTTFAGYQVDPTDPPMDQEAFFVTNPDASYQDFTTANAKWVARQEFKALKAQDEAKQAQTQAQKSWVEKAEKAKAKYQDFDDVLDAAAAPAPAVAAVMNRSPFGADIAYHLATHPEDYKRINAMDPVDSAFELGQLALKFSGTASPKPRTTNAPPPINPLVGTSAPAAPQHRRDTYLEIK